MLLVNSILLTKFLYFSPSLSKFNYFNTNEIYKWYFSPNTCLKSKFSFQILSKLMFIVQISFKFCYVRFNAKIRLQYIIPNSLSRISPQFLFKPANDYGKIQSKSFGYRHNSNFLCLSSIIFNPNVIY